MTRVRFVHFARAAALAVAAAAGLDLAGPVAAQPPRPSEAVSPAPAAGHRRMLALLQTIANQTPDTHPFLGDWRARELREELRGLPATDAGPNRWRVMFQLSGEELRLGNEAEAIGLLTDALALIPETDENRPGIDLTNYSLGVAYLRLAETRNCALHPHAEACILPLRGRGIHSDQTPSRQAIAAFTAVLRSTENAASGGVPSATGARNWSAGAPSPVGNDGTRQYLAALWLLNVAYMTVGGYPDEVPEPYRLPPETFRSAGTMPRFANIAPALGLDTFDMCGGAIADDFDGDGHLDIGVDNDGHLDLYVSAYTADIEHLAASALGRPAATEASRLYRGTGGGRFEDASGPFGLTAPTAAMGSNFGDLDNDGYPDFHLGTGYPPYHSVMPNVMYRNREGRGFSDVTYAGGLGHLQKGHGVAFADFDNDGDQDVFQQMGGAYPGDRFGNALYENPGFGNHWITIRLEGVRSNRSAIGARIRAVVAGEQGADRRSIYRHVNSGGSFGGNPLRQTIGLGRASRIERLEILWPATGITQTFTDVPADRAIHIVEGERAYSTLALRSFTLGSQGR